MNELRSTHRMRVGFSLLIVLVTAIFLAACGDDEPDETTTTQTTTVTSAEAEAAAEGLDTTDTTEAATTTTTPLSTAPSTEAQASSDAAAAIPGGDFVVQGAGPEEATTPTTAADVDPLTGEVIVESDGTTGQVDPATGLPVDPTGTPTTGVDLRNVAPNAVLAGSEAILARPFSADSPWNTPATGISVSPKSDEWIENADIRVAQVQQEDGTFKPDKRELERGLVINTTKWTVPVFSNAQEGAVERIAICRQFRCGEDAVTSVVIPLNACPDPRYDGWMTVIDDTTRTAYDFWRARCEADGSISYHYVKAWDLDGPGFQENLGVSARGSGLPLFAGLITPEEIRDGRIDHALAIAIPGAATRRYVRPASRTNGTGLRNSLPEGARITLDDDADLRRDLERRLRDSRFVRNKVQRRTARIILEALRRYGAIVVDRSKVPTMFAQRNANWTNILPLNLLQDLKIDDFRAMRTGQIFFDPPREGEGTFDSTTGVGIGSPPVTSTGSSDPLEAFDGEELVP